MNAIRELCLFVIRFKEAVSRSHSSLTRHDEYS
jgi:hypothetical protein